MIRSYAEIMTMLFDDRLDAKEIKYCVCCNTNNRLRVSLSVYACNYFLTCGYVLWEGLHVERELVNPWNLFLIKHKCNSTEYFK